MACPLAYQRVSSCCSCSSSRSQQQIQLARRSTARAEVTCRATAVHQHAVQDQQQLLPHSQAVLAAAALAVGLLCSSPVQAATAEANFGTKCVGCHVNGGNIIQGSATLLQEDLVKNGYADSDSLYKLIYGGKGRMPGFGQECAPKIQCTFGPKLTDEEVQGLAQYVQDQAAAGWKTQ